MRVLTLLLVILGLVVVQVQAHQTYVLNQTDTRLFYQGFQLALEQSPDRQATLWQNPATGLSGSTIPMRTFQVSSGAYCREYLATIERGQSSQQSYGTACRQSDSLWHIVSEEPVTSHARLTPAVQQPGGEGSCRGTYHSQEFLRKYHESLLEGRQERYHDHDGKTTPRTPPAKQPSQLLKLVTASPGDLHPWQ